MRAGYAKSGRGKIATEGRERGNDVLAFAVAMEEPLCRAISYGGALELIGFGLNLVGNDHGQAVLAIAEAMVAELVAVEKSWRQIMATGSDVRKTFKRRTQTKSCRLTSLYPKLESRR